MHPIVGPSHGDSWEVCAHIEDETLYRCRMHNWWTAGVFLLPGTTRVHRRDFTRTRTLRQQWKYCRARVALLPGLLGLPVLLDLPRCLCFLPCLCVLTRAVTFSGCITRRLTTWRTWSDGQRQITIDGAKHTEGWKAVRGYWVGSNKRWPQRLWSCD